MIPIAKNVEVVDRLGNNYAATYKRRANGLVKLGRAQWSDENKTKICLLAGPALYIEEDNAMERFDNNGNKLPEELHSDLAASAERAEIINTAKTPEEIVMYIMGQMEKIRSDNTYILEAFRQLNDMANHPPIAHASSDAAFAKAQAVGEIVKSREATNQKLLSMYERMYGDFKPRVAGDDKEVKLRWLTEMVNANSYLGESIGDNLTDVLKIIFDK